MANWQKVLAPFAHSLENRLDSLKYKLIDRLGGPGPIRILTYTGFGNSTRLYMKGRVLEDKGISSPSDTDSVWKNIGNTWKRINSREIPYARVHARFMDQEFEVTADEEGMFVLDFKPEKTPPVDRLWHEVEFTLLGPLSSRQKDPVKATGWIVVPSPQADFGVISDVDDTILVTNATNLLKVARVMFMKNARTRLPFPGAAAFYRALSSGTRYDEWNPMFYVSSSPWNIYDLLEDFLTFQEFPRGPVLFLRNWGITESELIPSQHREYKLGAIRRILDMHPELQFILIGDSGQQDPEIYSHILSEYPGKIRCIYIRNVTKHMRRAEEIRELAKKAVLQGCPLVLADNTLTMAEHAAEHGWIRKELLEEIARARRKDEAPPTVAEKIRGEKETREADTLTIGGTTDKEAAENIESGAIEAAVGSGETGEKKPPKVIIEPEKPSDPPGTQPGTGTSQP